MKVKCIHCPYECILETNQEPKYSDKDEFATVCVFDAGKVKWEIVEEKGVDKKR